MYLHKWKPRDQYGGRNGLPTISEYCFMTSAGVGPKKKYISKIPPIARKVIAGDGCNITSKNIEHYNIIDSIHVEKKNFNFNI